MHDSALVHDLRMIGANCRKLMQGQEDLLEMKVGDKINYIKCVGGCDTLLQPKK